MALRIGAACVMTISGAWGGRLLAGTQARRTQTLKEILEGIRRLNVEMTERRMPLKDALKASGGAPFGQIADEMGTGSTPAEAYRRSIGRLRGRMGALDSLEEADMIALGRLFEHLGEGGMQAQRLMLREAEEELERLCAQARARQEEYGRLYASLGALGGIALALLMM